MTTETGKTVIEINGVKLEVDLRTARRIDTLQIGSKVKCLVKQHSGPSEVYPGVIIGFEPFKDLPTIVVAYIDSNYYSKILHFKSFNSETKDFEVIADINTNALELNRDTVLEKFEREIFNKERDLETLKAQREFFMKHFGQYFGDVYANTGVEK